MVNWSFENEQKLKEYLEKKSKEVIIDLYLQSVWDRKLLETQYEKLKSKYKKLSKAR